MTAQISDTFIYRDDEYSLIGIKGDGLASPEQFGMEPVAFSTACYRGFYATYELTEESLWLRELTLCAKNDNYVPIGEKEPVKEYGYVSIGREEPVKKAIYATYHGLSVDISYTGEIRLAKDWIAELGIHMGFQKATAFRTVLDITLKNGLMTEINDRSQEMRRKFGDFKRRYRSRNGTPNIKDAFSLDMDLE